MSDWERKRAQQKREDQEKGRELAQGLMRELNRMGGDKTVQESFIKEVAYDHRTLQQMFGGLLVKMMDQWADAAEEGNFDGRNEALVKFCQKVREENKDIFKFGFPFI